jgi:hypothetical protein
MRGEVVSDRTSDEEESRVDFAFSSLRERIGSSLRSSGCRAAIYLQPFGQDYESGQRTASVIAV